MSALETDYLVVGAGAAGMAFVDALVAACDADVVMVDRRHRPGGHWNDTYPFVRLHQPSATYGVNSRPLGKESLDTTGSNAGYYERATGGEISEYFQKVLEEDLLPTGRVRFFGMCDYTGNGSGAHAFSSRLTGKTYEIGVRRKVVDTTYLQVSVPATHTPPFEVDADTRLIPVGGLVDLTDTPAGFTVLGAGKTAMDACSWLLENGVDPDRIRWVKPRESWVFDRASFQPLDLVVPAIDRISTAIEELAQADDVADLFRRLEACGELHRLDQNVEPTMYRGAILSRAEREALRQIERVVRQGRVLRVGTDSLVMQDGAVSTDSREIHVDCTASGFRRAPAREMFERGCITLQSVMGGFTTFSSALVGFVEAVRDDDAEKNRLCAPVPQPSEPIDWIEDYSGGLRSFGVLMAEPDTNEWLESSRLNNTRGLTDHMEEPVLQSAMARWIGNLEPALANADKFLTA